MSIKVLDTLDYAGSAGVQQVQSMQSALVLALQQQEWHEVQRLDKACAALVSRVIAAKGENPRALVAALTELKGVYSHLISGCEAKVASMAV